jgi:uncharacterized RDD family membrane protein YckC
VYRPASLGTVTGPVRTDDAGHPGDRFGLPAQGPGSVARFGRRLLALLVDWVICQLVVALAFGSEVWTGGNGASLAVLGVFVLEQTLLVGLLGYTVGHRLAGVRVVRLDGRPVGLLSGLGRAVLVALVVPPLVMDRDARGLHDLAAGTVVIRR